MAGCALMNKVAGWAVSGSASRLACGGTVRSSMAPARAATPRVAVAAALCSTRLGARRMASSAVPVHDDDTGSGRSARQVYEDDGYVVFRGVLDADLAGEMSDHVRFVRKKFPDIPPEHLHHQIMRNDPFWVRVCQDKRLVDVAKELAPFIQDDVALFSSHYFCKEPKTGKAVLWHQDGSYWPLRPMNVMTLWLAVDRSDTENGCLRVVKGSHVEELKDLEDSNEISNVLGSATHTDAEIDESLVRNLVLNPGDVSAHHPNIVHCSDPNTSNRRRCGLTIRYIAPTTECTDPEQPVMMMEGSPAAGVNSYRSWPKYREGYDFPFKGAETWNETRYVNPDDEAFFERTDHDAIDAEIRTDVLGFVDMLGGR